MSDPVLDDDHALDYGVPPSPAMVQYSVIVPAEAGEETGRLMACLKILDPLPPIERERVIRYVAARYKIAEPF